MNLNIQRLSFYMLRNIICSKFCFKFHKCVFFFLKKWDGKHLLSLCTHLIQIKHIKNELYETRTTVRVKRAVLMGVNGTFLAVKAPEGGNVRWSHDTENSSHVSLKLDQESLKNILRKIISQKPFRVRKRFQRII